MDITLIANRYARAFMMLASENNFAEQAYHDMQLIERVFDENRSLDFFLKSPIIPLAKKIKVVKSVFEPHLSHVTMRFLELVLRKDRTSILRQIALSFIELYKELNNIVTIQLEVPETLDDNIKQKLLQRLSIQTNKKVELVEKINPELIGGFVFHYNDLRYDASLRKKIDKLRKEFEKNPYVKQL